MSFNQDKACCPMPFPIIADDKRELSVLLGMLDPDERDKDGLPLTARCVSFHRNHALGLSLNKKKSGSQLGCPNRS